VPIAVTDVLILLHTVRSIHTSVGKVCWNCCCFSEPARLSPSKCTLCWWFVA